MSRAKLALAVIRLDGGAQPRTAIDASTVDAYAEDMRAGAAFPPMTVFYDGAEHWLADGFHRVNAARAAGLTEVDADVQKGTLRDAILFSVGANASHGLRRTNADKRRAVETLLADAEWSTWSDREIAKWCAVDHKTVAAARTASGEFPSPERTVRRGDSEYTMNVAGIGAANRERPAVRDAPTETREEPTPAPAPKAAHPARATKAKTEPAPAPVPADADGRPIPERLRPLWAWVRPCGDPMAAEVEQALDHLAAAKRLFAAWRESSTRELVQPVERAFALLSRDVEDMPGRLRSMLREIRNAAPSRLCADCGGEGCKPCMGRGFLFARAEARS